ncbi:MAG TPA: corrinoid protein, partial [Anaerovoracaceae bacterium]|nr:corrinoid protein [Anaerovoracaceae bacterium]
LEQVKELAKAMVDAGVDPLEIINKGLVGGMDIVAPLFKSGEMYIPEVLLSAKAMAAGVEIVKPYISDSDMSTAGTIVIGTVKGDLHDIGKNLVAMMLESSGFKVINLGIDIPTETFIAAIKEHAPDIVAMSALLTTTMMEMKETVAAIKKEGYKVKCIIGGAPISQEFAAKIGADGYSADAASAVELCKQLLA